jgi:hypothetical protein
VKDFGFLKRNVQFALFESGQDAFLDQGEPVVPAETLLREIEAGGFRIDDVNYRLESSFFFFTKVAVTRDLLEEGTDSLLMETSQFGFFQAMLKRKLFQISFMGLIHAAVGQESFQRLLVLHLGVSFCNVVLDDFEHC